MTSGGLPRVCALPACGRDRVGVWSPNRWEWPLVQFATAEIGVILVTINPAYRTHELSYVLKQAGAGVGVRRR